MRALQAIFFDFDGVLAESTQVKDKAFYDLYAEKGDDFQKRVYEYHCAHHGVSRFDKIQYVEKKFLGQNLTRDRIDQKAARFSDLVKEGVVRSDAVAGCMEFLEKYYKRFLLFVVSATPQEELEDILEARGMDQYFKSVHGSPVQKAEHIARLIDHHNLDPIKTVMVGDAMSDYEAARQTGVSFIGRVAEGALSPFPETEVLIPDLTHLEKAL